MFYRSLRTKISLLFILLTFIIVFILFGSSYYFLNNALKQDNLRELKSIILNMWALYEAGGVELIAKELSLNRFTDRAYLVRVGDRYNRTILFMLPHSWENYDFNSLETSISAIKPGISHFDSDGKKFTIITIKLSKGDVLQVGMSTEFIETFLYHYRQIYLLALIPILALSIVVSLLFSWRLSQPINKLIAAADNIVKTGDTGTRIQFKDRGDEVSHLVKLFNSMLERLDSSMERMRNTLDTVAHDLRTPMTRLKSSAEIALQSAEDPDTYRNALKDCIENSNNILTLLRELMDISEAETGAIKLERKLTDISSILNDVADLYRYVAEEKQVRITESFSPNLKARVDVNRFRQVIANLLDNAVKYTNPGGSVAIKTRKETEGENNYIVIEIEDTGKGIPKADIEKIWQRLYRGKNADGVQGLGLGLSLVKAIVHAHGGMITVKSSPGKGSVFTIRLPASI